MGESTLVVNPPAFVGRIGVARRDITPPVGIYARNWGAATHDRAEGIHRPMLGTVLTLAPGSDHGRALVLVSLDAGWYRGAEGEGLLRGTVLRELKLDPARLIINLTHTHSSAGISLGDENKPGGDMVRPYLESLAAKVIDATREAMKNAEPGVLTLATTRCDVAANRDLPDPTPGSKRYVTGFNPVPAEPPDDTMLVGRVTRDRDGKTIATLVNYACHPTTLAWENRVISPDFVGGIRDIVERDTGGAPMLFLQGASGELAPRWQYVGDTAVADKHGRAMGYAAMSAIEQMLPPRHGLAWERNVESGAALAVWKPRPFEPDGALEARTFDVDLPLKKLPTLAELQADLARHQGDRVMSERLYRKMQIIKLIGSGPTTAMPAWVWRLGRVLVVAHPNEAYSRFQRDLRAAFPGFAVVVMNLVNGSCGYLSPPELYDHEIYPVWQSPFERGGLETLTEACRRNLSALVR